MNLLKSPKFQTTLQAGSYGIALPQAVVAPFLKNNRKRVRVQLTAGDGQLVFHAAIQKRKDIYCMLLSKEKRKTLNLSLGDIFHVQLFEDETKYGVEPPEAFSEVMQGDPLAQERFDTLKGGQQRSVLYTLKKYKSVQLQVDKSLRLCENLKRGVTETALLLK